MENLQLKNCFKTEQVVPPSVKTRDAYFDANMCCYCVDSRLCIEYISDSGNKTEIDLPEELKGEIVHICYVHVWRIVFLATESTLIAFDVGSSKFSSTKYENSEAKVVQASWDPIETYLVIIDSLGLLSGYTFELDLDNPCGHKFVLVSNGSLDKDVPNSVYVGWGTHNTQFKGSKKHEEIIKEIPQKYSNPVISWRSNGDTFVVNYWKDNRRFLKVFDSTLRPLFESDSYNNLLAPTSFKGDGSFIACAATDGETNRIFIFEKNCLVMSSFLIPENRGEIVSVQYHNEKQMLGIQSISPSESCLNIYLYANDTWYLKQQLLYPNSGPKLLKFHWVTDLNTNICSLNVLTYQAVETYEFSLEAYGVFNDLVAVINGAEVSFTEFSQEIMPPPIASKTLQFERPVNKIYFYSRENVYIFGLSDGFLSYYKYESGDFEKYLGRFFVQETPNGTSSFETWINGTCYHIALSKEYNLTIDDRVVFRNVVSVHVHENRYLLFTHVIDDCYTLCSVRLSEETISNWYPDIFFTREVEQGAKIVCVTKKDQVILSMPRGNLETITSRLIAIDSVERLLCENNWFIAVNKIRAEKLNWNLLIDLDQKRFVARILDFVRAANTISLLNTIVTEFRTKNCLTTMYKAWPKQQSSFKQYILKRDAAETPKIEVLGAILDVLIQLNPVFNLVSIVSLQIKHYSVRAALKSVLHAFEMNELETCKRAVAQILRHKHADNVIISAFSLCNIDFLSFIYSECSEDPRVFTPEIETLKTLHYNDLNFVMNVRGRDFERATKFLVRLENKNATFLSDFIQKHGTQRIAYNAIHPGDSHFQLVTNLYANHLALKTQHNEAGLILETAGLYKDALRSYKTARNWRKVVALLNKLNIGAASKIKALRVFAKELVTHKQIDEAAHIYEHFCNDYQAAVKLFTEQKMFQKAWCLATQYNSDLLINDLLLPALLVYRKDLIARISDLGGKFADYTSRLMMLRDKKCQKLLRREIVGDSVAVGNCPEFERDTMVSEYGSLVSRSTVGTGASKGSTLSSRNRRKLEKKKIDLREGSVYEDIALIRQLYLLAVDIFAIGQQVADVCCCLIDSNSLEFGKMLQDTLGNIQCKVKRDIDRIWSDTFLNADATSTEPSIIAVIENRQELDEEFKTPPPPEKLREDWKLEIFN